MRNEYYNKNSLSDHFLRISPKSIATEVHIILRVALNEKAFDPLFTRERHHFYRKEFIELIVNFVMITVSKFSIL
jgi:hypothetical protein